MNATYLSGVLFAQVSRWERLGDGLHRGRGRMDPADFIPLAILLAIAAIIVVVVIKLRRRNDMSVHCDDPQKLFRELSLAHNLDRASQKLLWRLAESLNLTQPAEVFVRPAAFDAQLPVELHDQEAAYHALQQRLFS